MRVRRALLVVPPGGRFVREDRCQSPVKRHTIPVLRPPMPLAYAAAVLETAGVACTIRDYPAAGRRWPALRADLADLNPDLVVVSIAAAALDADLRVCRVVKRHDPTCLTVAKGGFAAVDDRAIVRRCPALDVLWRGEIDNGFAELAGDRPLEDVAGITFRRDGEIVRTPDRPFEPDLDALPLPARHLLDNDRYRRTDTGDRVTVIQTGRGCPAGCAFCTAQQMSGKRLRLRDPVRVADEVEVCVDRFGIRHFLFNADTFTWRRAWVVALCREIVRRRLRVRWACNGRVDRLDDERVRWMRRAGCRIISLGLESGCQAILDRYHKAITLAQAREAVACCRRHGVLSFAFVILGGPWETRETARQTTRFVIDADPDFVEFNILKVLPGTALYDDLAGHGQLGPRHGLGHYDWAGGLSVGRMLALRRRALLVFHLRPRYIARTLWRAAAQGQTLTYLWTGARHIAQLVLPSAWEMPGID